MKLKYYTVNLKNSKKPEWLLRLCLILSQNGECVKSLNELKNIINEMIDDFYFAGKINSEVYTEIVKDEGIEKIHILRNDRPVLICWFE